MVSGPVQGPGLQGGNPSATNSTEYNGMFPLPMSCSTVLATEQEIQLNLQPQLELNFSRE